MHRIKAGETATGSKVARGQRPRGRASPERGPHGWLEASVRELAAFLGVDDVVALVSGYLTNVSLVGHLLTKIDLIIVDELSHNSLIVGLDRIFDPFFTTKVRLLPRQVHNPEFAHTGGPL
jgi:7-keto-8-aminopelargonate synthetase-like enzyme